MRFYPLLDVTRPETLTPANIAGLRSLNLMPVAAYASLAHFAGEGGQGLPAEGTGPKFWRDNTAMFLNNGEPREYVFLARDAAGAFVQWEPNYSDVETMSIIGPIASFYQQYAALFQRIPRPIRKTYSADQAVRINFRDAGRPAEYPLAIADFDSTTFPRNIALRFNPDTGLAEAFIIEEYVRTYQMDWRPKTPPVSNVGTARLTDQEIVDTATAVVNSRSSTAQKAAAIRNLAGR